MKNQTPLQSEIADPTEALLQGLIAECRTVIRDEILPAARAGKYKDWQNHISDVTSVMRAAVRLADAVGRLRRPEPTPELRQRITVERVQRLSPPMGEGVEENG